MIDYKLCVCDMDGTLLDSKGLITQENETVLKKLQQMGLEIIIASGRVDLMVKSFIKQLNLRGHVISCNGGLIRNIETGEIIYSKIMDKAAVKEIIMYCLDYSIDFMIYTSDMVYSNKGNPKMQKFENLNKLLSADLQLPINGVDKSIIENIDDIKVLKVLLICHNDEETESLQKYFSKYDTLTAVSSARGLLDIMASDTSKGNALKILSEKTGVDLSKAIAFGDNYNDIEMLKCVGMPIAMGNSVEDVKSCAKYITKSNNESGVAYAINKYVLGE